VEKVRELLRCRAKTDLDTDEMALSLIVACEHENVGTVRLLLEAGAEANCERKTSKWTPIYVTLVWAVNKRVRDNAVEILMLLMRHGAELPDTVPRYIRLSVRRKLLPFATKDCKTLLLGLHERLGSDSPVALLSGDPFITKFIMQLLVPQWLLSPTPLALR
jgi:hypothetical protein